MANDTKTELKSEVPKPSMEELLTVKLAEALQKGMTDGISLAEMARQEAAKIQLAQKRGFIPQQDCPKCRQPTNVCGGPGKVPVDPSRPELADENHDLMAVTVNDRESEKYFRGVYINGVKYRSRNGAHHILVPKKNDIAYICSNYEKTEQDQRVGKIVSHDSGLVGRNVKNTRPFPAIQR